MDSKQDAKTLAGHLFRADGDSEQIKVLARRLGYRPGYAPPSGNRSVAGHPGWVGPWKPETRDGATFFVKRPLPPEEADLWSPAQEIPPKSASKRIVLLGESVARGYFYEPGFTPAGALEHYLNAICAGEAFEVIDLACISITIGPLERLCRDALLLEPDGMVVLAGNNWGISLFESMPQPTLARLVDALGSADRFDGIRAVVEDELTGMVESFLTGLASLQQQRGMPVFVLIPEFNLGDWHSNEIEQSYLFPDAHLAEFLAVRQSATEAAGRGEWDQVEALGKKLAALNKANPLGYEWMAQAALARGEAARARSLVEQAKDAAMYHLLGSPRCYTVVQHAMRRIGPRLGLTLIDLPEVFGKHHRQPLPDRKYFLDYCHFSLAGICLSMAETAGKVARALGHTPGTTEELLRMGVEVPADVSGLGSLLAAMHNAHWGQPYEIVRHHCRQAAEAGPRIRQAMENIATGTCAKGPAFLTGSFYRLKATRLFDHDRSIAQERVIDLTLLEALHESLQPYSTLTPGHTAALRTDRYGKESVSNLLNRYYCGSAFRLPGDT